MEKYSFSKLRCFESCKLCYYKKYIEENRTKLNHGTSEFGTFMHYILEQYEKGNLEISQMLPYYTANFNQNIKSSFDLRLSESFTKNFRYKYFEDGKSYLKTFNGYDKLTILESEYEFDVVIDDKFIFTGKVDLIARDSENKLIIIDHKSKSKFMSEAEKKEYAVQLYLYAYAVYKKYKEMPYKLMFNMFRTKTWEIFDFNQDEYLLAIDWLKNTVKEIECCLDFNNDERNEFFCWNFCQFRESNYDDCRCC